MLAYYIPEEIEAQSLNKVADYVHRRGGVKVLMSSSRMYRLDVLLPCLQVSKSIHLHIEVLNLPDRVVWGSDSLIQYL